jgi:hypothetical protein
MSLIMVGVRLDSTACGGAPCTATRRAARHSLAVGYAWALNFTSLRRRRNINHCAARLQEGTDHPDSLDERWRQARAVPRPRSASRS